MCANLKTLFSTNAKIIIDRTIALSEMSFNTLSTFILSFMQIRCSQVGFLEKISTLSKDVDAQKMKLNVRTQDDHKSINNTYHPLPMPVLHAKVRVHAAFIDQVSTLGKLHRKRPDILKIQQILSSFTEFGLARNSHVASLGLGGAKPPPPKIGQAPPP